MRHKKATDYHNSPTFRQLWDALGSKLIEAAQGRLTLNQPVQGSTPWRLTLANPVLVADILPTFVFFRVDQYP